MPDKYHLISDSQLQAEKFSYVMTDEQMFELREEDLPYCPSAFIYCKGNFKKYKAYIKLRAFRVFGWAGSADLELGMGPSWRKSYDYSKRNQSNPG